MATSVKVIVIIRGQVSGNDIGQGNRNGANCDNAFCNGIGNRNHNLYGSGNIKGTGIMENKKKLQFHSANFRTARVNTLNCTLCISKLICAANVFLFFDQFFKNAIFSIF